MASTFAKSVTGATKVKLAAPKSKYIEHILIATHSGEHGVAEIFRALQNRLRDSTWTVVFKSLIVVHLMLREGQPEVTLRYLAQSPHRKLAISNFTEAQPQGRNIRTYEEYLLQRAVSYNATKIDYVRGGEGRLKRLSIDKGLLRETESVQDQIRALLRCDLLSNEPENEITVTAFRLLTMDLLALFHIMNEGTINVLEHYLEMSKPDAERALKIYKNFTKQTDHVVRYLSVARQFEYATRLEIPKIKHAPTSLAHSLEEHLNDKDFEINRRQYLAQLEAKRSGKSTTSGGKPAAEPKSSEKKPTTQVAAEAKPSQPAGQAKAPPTDLIDFFDSIEQNQQTLPAQPQPQAFDPRQQQQLQQQQLQQQQQLYMQQTGNPWQGGFPQGQPGPAFPQQNTGFVQPPQSMDFVQPQATGFAGSINPFGPSPQQPQQQQQQQMFPGFGEPQTGSNPFPAASQPGFQPSTLGSIPQNGVASFPPQQQQQQAPPATSSPFAASPLVAQPTAGNPFRISTAPASLTATPTGNPFAHSASASSPASAAPTPSLFTHSAPSALLPQPTGTNPFARPNPSSSSSSPGPTASLAPHPPAPAAPLTAHATGSTNPFRQSAFVNPQTGAGWQRHQAVGTGLDHLETTAVFPRPGQQTQTQQQGSP